MTDCKLMIPQGHPPFAMRLPLAEKQLWMYCAEAEGYKSLSTWIKAVIRHRVEWIRENEAMMIGGMR